ncbi:hypothetical protein F511_15596 [Dorcoceras hygrometricum]|uniref:Uncharacterized protein n=1 Tax=Dorcoceras hygrometricum TaxID=472368 RepID=A0A2Z7B9D9_9LAMI|nr:hypothetical protein F511_15596 [Dorcoceras hygrometricum]
MRYNDQDTSQPDRKGKGKVGIGYQRPENSKPGWLKNKLNEDKEKAGPKFFVPNQPRHYSKKAKTEWTRNQPRRNPYGQRVDSLEHDLRFVLGPAIFSRVEQEERLYFVQSLESPPAVSPHHASSSSSTDVSLHFDFTDVPMHAPGDHQAPASVEFTKFTEALEDLRSSLAQRIDNSNCEMLSKLNAVEVGVRGDILKVQSLLRQSFETACRVLERQSNTQTAQITDLKKGLMAPVGTIFGDLFDIKKKQREQDARLIAMDEQIAAIRNEHLDFQSKIAADILSLSTQVGDIADFLRSGAAKKGEKKLLYRNGICKQQWEQ